MFSFEKNEVKRNLLGALEVALFMHQGRDRFGESREEALRSFLIPTFLLPVTLLFVYVYPKPELSHNSADIIAFLYALRMVLIWGLFLGSVYWLATNVKRKQYFYKFVTASNWLAVPATAAMIPTFVMWALGAYGWSELYPFVVCVNIYTYAFTAFMAAYVLRVPWELAGFIATISILVDNYTESLVSFLGSQM